MANFNNHTYQLVEDRQVFNEGTSQERVRQRQGLQGAIKEKMHPGEDPRAAVSRAFQEELKIVTDVDFSRVRSEDLDKESPSYPGLRSQYRAHYFEAELVGDQIKPEGYMDVESDKTTYFVWRQIR